MQITGPISAVLKTKPADIWRVHPDETVYEAIRQMSEHDVGSLLVMEEDKLVGIFSERDYTRKVVLQGRSSKETQVREVISSPVIAIAPADTVEEGLKQMTEKRVRHLPVVSEGAVLGIVSIGDLVKWVISTQTATIDHLERFIAGEYPR